MTRAVYIARFARMVLRLAVGLLFLLCSLFAMQVQAFGCSEKHCYVRAFESVDPAELPEVHRVRTVFNQLTKTIGLKETISAELLIINSDQSPWAIALADNTVVLTKGAIKLFYQGADPQLGDARAAFVIGHELAHVLSNDLFHHRAFSSAFTQAGISQQPLSDPWVEQRADLMGFTYATIAGYSTHRLLEGDNTFFHYWVRQIEKIEGRNYPDESGRAETIRAGLAAMAKEAVYYRVGILLAHSGRYRDAQKILTNYLKNTEAKTRELYNNLGYVHLQLARTEMSDKQAYKYWIPSLLELDAPEPTRSMFGDDISANAQMLLEQAEKYFKIAIEMNDSDPISLLNLTAVYLYQPGNIHNAYASVKNALARPALSGSLKTQLEAMYYLIFLEDDYDSGDRWTRAREWYEATAGRGNADDNIVYNLARMLDDRGRDDTSTQYWRRLLEVRHSLPDVYRDRVCYRLGISVRECVAQTRPQAWLAPKIPTGVDLRVRWARECLQRDWTEVARKKIGDTAVQVFTDREGNEIIALDNYIEMLVVKDITDSTYRSIQSISDLHGEHLAAQFAGTNDRVLYRFKGASALADRTGRVQELWLFNLLNNAEDDRCRG
jgi:hypothetical protein